MAKQSRERMFDSLEWSGDSRFRLHDLDFRLQTRLAESEATVIPDDHFRFWKVKTQTDSYNTFFQTFPGFRVENLFELGIWDGGSTALWFELLQPKRHLAVDLSTRGDSPYFSNWAAKQDGRVKTYWGVDQSSAARLRSIVFSEGAHPLDLVIDDASHMYGPTRASFEALFPLLRPGGWYIIEDWGWDHWPESQATEPGIKTATPLVAELVALIGSDIHAQLQVAPIVYVTSYFAAIQKGARALDDISVSAMIRQRPRPSPSSFAAPRTTRPSALEPPPGRSMRRRLGIARRKLLGLGWLPPHLLALESRIAAIEDRLSAIEGDRS